MRSTFTAMAFVILATTPGARADDAPAVQTVISGQIDSFKAKDHGKAFSYAAPGIRLMFRNEDNFARMVRQGYMPIYGARAYRFGRNRVEGPDTMYQEVLLTGPSGKSWVALYTMKRGEGGVWKIGGVQLLPGNERAT